jgi:protein-S-isoprenylcysteine O-methyltransferase Ste14
MTVAILFRILYWAWIGSETLLQIFMRTRRNKGEVKDGGSLLLLLPVLFCSVWAALDYGGRHPHNMFGGADWLRSVALIVMVAGLAIRWTAIVSLGRSFSTNVAIRTEQTLHTAGLYRWMRHPSYTGMLLCFASMGIYERNWVSLAISVVFPFLAVSYRIHVEERALSSAFGENYTAYCRQTRRILPGIY